ncbi:MAG: NAD(P)/FAD-dependent oxidoreductase [Candidatus Sungbacteria bacterium]|uniref:NAD(P)/FAD-dependent oxidoreductase n=1 Tax=Candidatus Sungiibacteriota bacterium TaxID=2750080 RepID=A0A931SE34_9BACT|nr:NAD(P)/FAD-dependent oxidoreductase [Candidatus Sungbacteria bacterium]
MQHTKKNIVIAGAGFGGITAALLLDKAFKRNRRLRDRYQIVIVNKHRSHLYTPALYEIASIPQGTRALDYVKSSITIPLASIFDKTLVEWQEQQIVSIDRQRKEIRCDNGEEISYEYLLLALGSETAYFNIPGAQEHGYPLKTLADAVRLRDRIQDVIESKEPVAKIVIAGGGASGVEVAAEFENFICELRDMYHAPHNCQVEVTLVEAGPEILAGFDHWLVAKARQRLSRIGVTVKTHTAITAVEKDKITLKDASTLPYTVLVWAGGVRASSVLTTLGVTLTPKQSVPVNSYLEVEPKIFAIGDNAAFVDPRTHRPLPWNVPIAEAEAKIAATNIIADIKGKPKRPFFPSKKYPFILAVGRKYAIADLIFLRESGILAWALKQLVELRYLMFILPFLSALSTWWKYVTIARAND